DASQHRGSCAFRTDDRPGATAPMLGLTPQRGRHRPALDALNPLLVEARCAARRSTGTTAVDRQPGQLHHV
ncbi:MAG: hypothetical protein ABWY39_07000, partial [Mycobacterium sp.]